MRYLLNAIYLLVFLFALPWLLYRMVRFGKYRAGYGEKFFGMAPVRSGNQYCVWLHAVSVGEVNLVGTLLKELERQRPEWQYVISTTTVTGFGLALKKFPKHTVFYCPLDFTWSVERAIRRVRPNMLVLAELEIWPNLIHAAAKHQVPVAVINGRLSEKSHRGYSRLNKLWVPVFERISLVAAQNQEYAERFAGLGVSPDRLAITGSLKYDGARSDRRNPDTLRLRELAKIANDDQVFLAGSTQDPEEDMAVDTFEALIANHPRLRLIIVPRHVERFDEVADMLDESGIAWQRRSALDKKKAKSDARILLVDTVGELGAWWGMADVAFVGGSMGKRGGQNMIEPASYGAAVSFGPNTKNFRDIVANLLAAEAAVVVKSGDELTTFVERCLDDQKYSDELGQRARDHVAASQGATRKTVIRLLELAAKSPAPITGNASAANVALAASVNASAPTASSTANHSSASAARGGPNVVVVAAGKDTAVKDGSVGNGPTTPHGGTRAVRTEGGHEDAVPGKKRPGKPNGRPEMKSNP